jgi:NAD+ synthase (glutamine-hydrolysing)
MRSIRLALAQLNPTVGDLEGNFQRVVESIEQARRLGVDVLAFPEMMITGYMPEDLLLKPSFIDRAIERTHALEPFTTGMTVSRPAITRKLAAILIADVVGFSRHMERDEAGTSRTTLPRVGPDIT